MEFSYTAAQKKALKLLGGKARNVMLFGGSRSGKTFLLCTALLLRALRVPHSRHAIIRRYLTSLRGAVGRDTIPKVLTSRFKGRLPCEYNHTENFFTLDNGAEIWLIGLDDAAGAEKILGKEFVTLYFNECSELDFAGVQTAMTRLAQKAPPLVNKSFFDCNPPGKRHWSYQLFIEKINPLDRLPLKDPELYASMRINPRDNADNLPPGYIESTLGALPYRQRERFLEGRWLDEVSGALWKREMIDRSRVVNAPELCRIVIGVDPAVTSGNESDRTGIVGAGLGMNGEYYVLADRSLHGTPQQWCNEVISLCRELDADRVVGEVNNGGDLIEALLRHSAPELSFKAVLAAHGKLVRAEPVAALYEKDLVHHVGSFPDLEEEMCSFSPLTATHSPDRMDALVWALTELSTAREHPLILA